MGKEQSTFIDKVKTAAQDAAVYAGAALAVTPANIVLQNLKVRKQTHGGSLKDAATELNKTGGKARFFNGFIPYSSRIMGVFAFGGLALEAAKEQTKDLGYGRGTTAVLNAAFAGAVETAVTGYMEGAELVKTKNLSFPAVGRLGTLLSTTANTAYYTSKIAPLLYGRNILPWMGAAAADYYGNKYNLPIEQRATIGTTTGFVAGFISTSLDAAATAAFGEKSAVNTVKKILDAGPQAMMRGAGIRSVQTAAFTAAATVAMKINEQGRG